MEDFETRTNKIRNTLFTELRIKPLNKIHDSGFRCFEITGYNCFTKEEMLITTVSDVIGFPCVKNPYDTHYCMIRMDWHPNDCFMRLFTSNPDTYMFRVMWMLSDFEFQIVETRDRRWKI